MARIERKLAAILAADVSGYSALVGKDEEATIRSFNAHLSALSPIIGTHSGRLFKTMGDGFLVEFGSVVDAVSCAVAMQRRIIERNADEPEDAERRSRAKRRHSRHSARGGIGSRTG